MKVCLDLHDFSVVNSRLDLLFKLRDHFPNFKVSLFTVPVDLKAGWGIYTIRDTLLREIKENLSWMQFIPHGYTHNGHEMRNCDYGEFQRILEAIVERFKKDGLPFENGFCAPHWRWSNGVVMTLDELGWWGAVDPRQPNMCTPKKFYKYNTCIDQPFPEVEALKLHGHMYGTKNDLGLCIRNLLELPLSTEWYYVTDFIEGDYAY